MLYTYLLVLLFGISDSSATTVVASDPTHLAVLDVQQDDFEVIPDYFQYFDGKKNCWVTIVPLSTLQIKDGPVICQDYLNSEVRTMMQKSSYPDTLAFNEPSLTYLVYHQRHTGAVISNRQTTHHLNMAFIERASQQFRGQAPPPPPLPRHPDIGKVRLTEWAGPEVASMSLPLRASDLMDDKFSALVAGPDATDYNVREAKDRTYQVDWPFYTSFMDGDTLTANMLGSDTDRAFERLGLSDTAPCELMVTIERYIVDRHGKVLFGPYFIGPMTKVMFDKLPDHTTTYPPFDRRLPRPTLLHQ